MTFSGRWKKLPPVCLTYASLATILLLGIISYANTLDVPLQFDDSRTLRISVGNSRFLYSLHGFVSNPRWFTDLTFALNRALGGERVPGYHIFNLAVHLSAATVVYLLVQRSIDALKTTWQVSPDDRSIVFLRGFIPFSSAALFVCHPLQTQAVTYISQRYTSLATLLYLGSLLAYLQARLSSCGTEKKLTGLLWGAVSFLLALLALKSKQIAFTLPLMAVVLEYGLFQGRLLKTRLFRGVAAGILLAAALLLIDPGDPGSLFRRMETASVETGDITRGDYLLTQFRVVATYLRLLLLPVSQNLDYDYPVYRTLADPAVAASLLLHLLLAGAALALFLRSQRRFASAAPAQGIPPCLASLGIVWFYLALSIESSVIPIRDVINEHRLYLPSVGFFMSAACIAGSGLQARRYGRELLWGAVLLLCVVFTAGTVARNRVWSDEMTLWQDVLAKSPDKARARHAVGTLYFKRFMPEKALPLLAGAVEREPGDRKYWITLNEVVASLDGYRGRSSSGMEYHLTHDTVDPRYRTAWIAVSYNNLGLAYVQLGNLPLARETFRKAVSSDPSLAVAWLNLALLAARQNDRAELAGSLTRLRELNPLVELSAKEMIRKQAPSVELVPQ